MNRRAVKEEGFKTLTLVFDPRGAATLRLTRAFDDAMVDELMWAFAMLVADARVRVIVVVTGAHGGGEQNLLDAAGLSSMMSVIHECPKPVVATVHGTALGGVVGLCCVCDIVMATPDASFAISEARVDVSPAVVAPYLLNVIGRREAQRLSLTNDAIDAARAVGLQLVTEVIDEQRMDEVTERIVGMLLTSSPDTMVETKNLFRQWTPPPPGAAFQPRLVNGR